METLAERIKILEDKVLKLEGNSGNRYAVETTKEVTKV